MTYLPKIILIILLFCPIFSALISQGTSVKDALKKTGYIVYPANGKQVDKTVSEELKSNTIRQATILSSSQVINLKGASILQVSIADEGLFGGLEKFGYKVNKNKDWIFIRIDPSGNGEIVASKMHLLYTAFCHLQEVWINEDISKFEKGRLEYPTFQWLEGMDGLFPHFSKTVKNYDLESTFKDLARLGCSHISINGIASKSAYEQGPPGEIYFRFYEVWPDLDQFVESTLNKGTYPPEYLQSNLEYLKKNAKLALKYGLTPGLNCCSPRSVPESLLQKYPFLRGARVDHAFRSYRPRYTLALSHPAVKYHYAELMKNILKEIPELAYIFIWSNDSGSGFEYITKLYPGRNGGAYLIREWVDNDLIAKAAAKNVVDYYELLRDAASEINPDFRVISGLAWFWSEGDYILDDLKNRLDLVISPSDKRDLSRWKKMELMPGKGSYLFSSASIASNFIIGAPFPWLAYERLKEMTSEGFNKIQTNVNPKSLVQFDVNREILFEFQLNNLMKIDEVIKKIASKWVGSDYSQKLIDAWKYADQAIRSFPDIPLYGNSWGFPWYRHLIRPFVPNIEKIPEKEREYYEKYMITTFNNPTNIDFDADCLWSLFSLDKIPKVEKADKTVEQCDKKVWEPLNRSINILNNVIENSLKEHTSTSVFIDQRDRLLGLRCYYRTLRNIAAWVGGVHGYIQAKNETEKSKRLKMVQEMVRDEIQNTKDLLKLFQNSNVNFIPISSSGETFYMYGDNFPDFLKKKIALMEKYSNDEPYINPDYMWRMPPGSAIDESQYLKYLKYLDK